MFRCYYDMTNVIYCDTYSVFFSGVSGGLKYWKPAAQSNVVQILPSSLLFLLMLLFGSLLV